RLPPMVPPRSVEDDEKALLRSLDYLNSVAAKNNVTVFLEPLNRYEDHMINTLEKGAYYIRQRGYSHVSLTADFYHMNIEENNIPESLNQYNNYIGHIHLADNHRYQPGSGHTNFREGFNVLKEIGYKGAFAIECRVIGDKPDVAYLKSLNYIRNISSQL
ncbi:MAG: TIM barrel protein, partial [Chitinophagaceae bacterium]